MNYTIRKARPNDIDTIVEFCHRIWLERDYSRQTWSDWQNNSNRTVWIAEKNRTPIGVIRGEILSSYEAWMEGLRVDPDSHSHGLGSALYSILFEELKALGMTAIRNLTAINNTPAHRLVEKHGFNRVICVKRRIRQIETSSTDKRLVLLHPGDLPLAIEVFEKGKRKTNVTSFLSSAKRLYCFDGVHWKDWTEHSLTAHLEAGDVWVWKDPTPQAIAVVSTSPIRPGVWDVGLLEGSRTACRNLLAGLAKREAMPSGNPDYPPAVRTFLPMALPRLQRAACDAGFTSDRVRHKAMFLWEWRADRA